MAVIYKIFQMNQSEIDPEVFENLSSMFPNAPSNLISTYLQLYTFDDAVFTLQLFYPNNTSDHEEQTTAEDHNETENHSQSISQEEIDESVSKILEEFPDFDDEYCLILLEDSNYDVEKAKKEARALIQYQQKLHESNKRALFENLKSEFQNVDDVIIENVIECACNDYEKAKSYILENTPIEQTVKSTKKKQRKTYLDGNGQAIESNASKKQKKNKKRSEFISINPKRDEREIKHFESVINPNENQSNQFLNETNPVNDNESSTSNQTLNDKNSNNSQIKLIDTQTNIQNKKRKAIYDDNDDIKDEDEFEEREFYKNVLSSNASSSSKFKVKKTTRMPERFLKQPDLTVREINLHGMNADTVSEYVVRALRDAENSNVRSIRFVTGAGHHSKNNIPVLRPLVFSICKKLGYKPTLSTDRGCVIVNIK